MLGDGINSNFTQLEEFNANKRREMDQLAMNSMTTETD
jgi:hypothetical protein